MKSTQHNKYHSCVEYLSLPKSDVTSLDFVVTRFLMKLFRTSSIDVVNDCRHNFSFLLPSEQIEVRKAKFETLVYNVYGCS